MKKTIYCNSTFGVFVLASYLEHKRPGRYVFRDLPSSPAVLIEALEDSAAHFCLSIGSIGDTRILTNLISRIRACGAADLPPGKIIAGGSAFSCIDVAEIQARYPEVSHIVVGQGETALLQILEGNAPPGVLNSASLAPAGRFPLAPVAPWHPGRPVPIGRHDSVCQWGRCRFCHHSELTAAGRTTIEDLAEEIITFHQRFGHKAFFLYDNHLEPAELEVLLRRLHEHRTDVALDVFGMRMIPAVLALERTLRDIPLVRSFGWGLEVYSQRVLNLHRKGILVRNMMPILEMAKRLSIHSRAYVLAGLPGCRAEDYEATRDFIKQNRLPGGVIDDVILSWFILNPSILDRFTGAAFQLRLGDPFQLSGYFGNPVEFSGVGTVFHDFHSLEPDYGWTGRGELFLRHAAVMRDLMTHPGISYDYRSFFIEPAVWEQVWGDQLLPWLEAHRAPVARADTAPLSRFRGALELLRKRASGGAEA